MTRDSSLDVAVTGIAARFPGPPELNAWWSSILKGSVHLRTLSRDKLVKAGAPSYLVDDIDYVPVHGFLEGSNAFDHEFFKISPREAQRMDPQHRIALEVAWNAYEDSCANVNGSDNKARKTAVFASSTGSGYQRWVLSKKGIDPAILDDLIHGTEADFMASRIAYKLGFTGPALAVQTACSSSLVAVHMAAQALASGDCDRAVVVATGLHYPQSGYIHIPGGVQSPTGRCLPFDASADGVVGGSGAASVVLELADGLDPAKPPPYGLILGSAINNDGAAKMGYYSPSATGQEQAVREAVRAASIAGSSIGYLEAHGTGTRIGDPVEWQAADSAYRAEGAVPGQIAVGAVKANIGHLDSCAGLAALIKALFVLRTGSVPPVAGFTEANPLLAHNESSLFVPLQAQPWRGPEPRRAGVSAFGMGGTNAHVILEAAQPAKEAFDHASGGLQIIPLSAANASALNRVSTRLAETLIDNPELSLDQVASTMVRARSSLSWRRAVVADSTTEAAELLSLSPATSPSPSGTAPLTFVFAGQGAQVSGMALPYIRAIPGFESVLDATLDGVSNAIKRDHIRAALVDTTFPSEQLNQTALAQPAIVALQIAVQRSLVNLGVTPAAVIGHSLGEVAASVAAGVVDPIEAVNFAIERGRAMQACPPGLMLALGCSEAQAYALIDGTGLELAAVNSPESCVVAGPVESVISFTKQVGSRFFCRQLRTTRAFHSRQIESALPALARAVESISASPATCHLGIATDASVVESGTVPDLGNWVRAARETVRFGSTLDALRDRMPQGLAVEIGPGRSLAPLLEEVLPTVTLGSRAGSEDERSLLTGLAELWVQNQAVDLQSLTPQTRMVRLPGYPFSGPDHHPEITPDISDSPKPQHPQSAMMNPPPSVESVMDISELVSKAWRNQLGLEAMSDDLDFFEAGGDSLNITRMVQFLSREVGVRLPVRELLRARTFGGHVNVVKKVLASTD